MILCQKIVWILAEVMAERGITVAELSAQTGISRRTIRAYCANTRGGFLLENLDKLCRALECQPKDLLVIMGD